MKILAVRGNNLASLAGNFEVPLETGALATAGLFAIIGPTGAGKSTILDAICLALYDKTPRLDAKSGVLVGDASEGAESFLGASDVRSILRKGTASGFAEVDFLGHDGKRHRARWSVHRARDRATGKLQAQKMTLEHLDTGEQVGGTKSEVQEAIVALVGLTFEQFRRSALLAQGEFAAFLQAKGGERAELLEKMTGTEIYQRISKQAFERAKEERAKLTQLESEVADAATLDEGQRAALEAELVASKIAVEQAKASLAAVVEAQTWFATLDGLAAARDEATTTLGAAQTACNDAGPEREELAAVEAVQPLRPTVEAADLAETRVGAARDERAKAEIAEATSANEVQRTQGEVDATKLTLAERVQGEEAHRPLVARARELDTQIETAGKATAEAMATQTAKATELESARAEVLAVQGQLAQATGALARAETELTARAKYDRLADEWPRWQAAIGRGRSALALLGSVPLSALAAAEQHATTAHATAVTSLAQAEGALTSAQTEAAEMEAKLAALEPEKVRHERAELQAQKPRVIELGAALGEVLRLSKEAAKAHTQEVAMKEKAALEAELAAAAEQARVLAQAKLETAESKLETAEAMRDLESYRALLVEDSPCLLCGSKDHPYGRRAPKVDERLVKAKEEVAACRKDVKANEGAVANHASRATTAAENAKEWGATAKELETALRAEAKRYGAARKACPEAELPTDPTEAGTTAALNKHQRVLEELLAASLAAEKAVVGLEKRAKGARELRDQRQVAIEAIRKGVEAAKGTLEAAARKHDEARTAHANATTALDAAVEELSPAFDEIGPFRANLERDAKSFEASCAAQVVEQKRLREERTRLAVAIEQAKPKEAEATTRLSERTEAHKAAQELALAKKSEFEALAATRRTVLDGRSVSEVLDALQKGLEQARDAHEQATTSHQQASVRHAEITTLCAKAGEAVAEREGEFAAAQTALAAALGPRSLADVRVLLAHDAAWMESRRGRREASRAAVERATTILAEREEQHGKHLATGAPALASETLTESLATAKTAVEDAEKGRQTLQLRLHDDDEARARRGAKAVELEQQRQRTEFREKLSEVIGSADGKKLRVFAQNLTFGALLEEANHHLRQLSHRYSLAPAAQGDLEFQIIDHDMADEVRSSSTLSGGESFLVSLALALGLSSLGASKTRVESLFIDEGFGTLDGRSLDAALASLEALQATGRQIGIISHVERLAAKISARVNVKRSGMRSVVSVEEG